MATLKELNLRLNSLGNTKKITQAMKLIATTKMSRSVQRVRSSENYRSSLNQIVRRVVSVEEGNHVLTQQRKPRKIRVMLISADRGLCGSFNSNLFKELDHNLRELNKESEVEIDCCGLKGFNIYRKSHFTIKENFENIIKKVSYEDCVSIGTKKIEQFEKGELDHFYIAYNDYVSALVQKPTVKRLIPYSFENSLEETIKGKVYLEPNFLKLSKELISRSFYFEIFYALLNSVAGENAARMRAMDNATNNCEDMISSLTLERNRARQASITNELIEIISGSESL